MSEKSSNVKFAVVIPAGGGGTRLWPRSRQHTPKQFLDIVSQRTMLQETADRVADLLSPERLFVITNAKHVTPVREQLPDVPAQNIVGEPQGRDSAPAIGLMAALLERILGPDTIMAVLPADHVITDAAGFRNILLKASEAAAAGYLVTIGIEPTGPDTGFGYIQSGDAIAGFENGLPVKIVKQFREKPDRDTAVKYLEQGNYYWNAGMFITTVSRLRSLYQSLLPEMEEPFAKIVDALINGNGQAVLNELFPAIRKISFDYAIMEKADKVAVVPANIGWNDVGSWGRLAEVLSSDTHENANVVVGNHIGIDTNGSLIYSPNRLIATIGMDDIIVIDTPDATLICPKSRSEDVKQIVETLKAQGNHHLL